MSTTAHGHRGSVWEQVPVAAESYERDLVPVLFEPWARDLVALADPKPGERVLDLACGTGIVARMAATRVSKSGTVTGLDVNEAMLAVARQVAATVRPAIEWKHASAMDTGLPDAAFEVAFCQQGLQFFPDRQAAVRELHRVMTPGGRALLSVWCDADSPGYVPFTAAFERHIPEAGEAIRFLQVIFGLDNAGELDDLLSEAGFRDAQISRRTGTVRSPSGEAWAHAFLGAAPIPAIATLAAPVRTRIAREVAEALRDYGDGDGLAFPVDAIVAVAYR
jgi:SAM-dependent methyltransferase